MTLNQEHMHSSDGLCFDDAANFPATAKALPSTRTYSAVRQHNEVGYGQLSTHTRVNVWRFAETES